MALKQQKVKLTITFDDDLSMDPPDLWPWEAMINPAGQPSIDLVEVEAGRVKDYDITKGNRFG